MLLLLLLLLQVLLLLLVMLCVLPAALVVMIRWRVLAVPAIKKGWPWLATMNAIDSDDVKDNCWLLVLAVWLLCWPPLVQHWYSESKLNLPANG